MPAPEYCFLWVDWWPLCMTKAEWSGWVQAFGAIAAILAGFIYVAVTNRFSRAAAKESERSARRRMLHAVLVAAANAEAVVAAAFLQIDKAERSWEAVAYEAERADALLASIPLMDIGDAEVIQRVAILRGQLRGVVSAAPILNVKEMTEERRLNSRAFFGDAVTLCSRIVSWLNEKIRITSTEAERAQDAVQDPVDVKSFAWERTKKTGE